MPIGVYKRIKPIWNKDKKGWTNSGSFKKGHPNFLTKETNKKNGIKLKERWSNPEYKKRLRKIAIKNGVGKWNKGKKMLPETKRKISLALRGEKSHLWKGGISIKNRTVRENIMSKLEYKLWRKSVFERDNYTCIWCGDNKGGNLEADHILPFADYPELRFAIDNGRILCKKCHRRRHIRNN